MKLRTLVLFISIILFASFANAGKLTQQQYDSYIDEYVNKSKIYQDRVNQAKAINHMPNMAKNTCELLKLNKEFAKISGENKNLRDAREAEKLSNQLVNQIIEILKKQELTEYRICNWGK